MVCCCQQAPGPAPHDHPPILPHLVPNRFGPYVKEIQADMSKGEHDRLSARLLTDVCLSNRQRFVAEYPFVSGYGSGACYWGKVEPANGHFNFSLCRAAIEGAHAAGKNVLINPQTGSEAPTSWLPVSRRHNIAAVCVAFFSRQQRYCR